MATCNVCGRQYSSPFIGDRCITAKTYYHCLNCGHRGYGIKPKCPICESTNVSTTTTSCGGKIVPRVKTNNTKVVRPTRPTRPTRHSPLHHARA
jgi:hypothetical protein